MADLRASFAAGVLLLAGCSGDASEGGDAPVDEGSVIACAVGSASEFTRNCSVERAVVDGVLTLVIHHDDGGFRRLTVMDDGSGVTAADGADSAAVTVFDGEIEVAIGEDRYMLPATIAGPASSPDAAE